MKQKDTTIPPDLIRKALDQILNCDEIRNSQILARFLQYVVTETLSGNEDEIKEYTIGVKALGRPSDFNPQLDAVVRIHAGRLRRTMYQYYQGQGKEDPVIINIPKGTYVPVFRIRGAPLEISAQMQGFKIDLEDSNNHTAFQHEHNKPVLAVIPFHNLSEENSKDFFVAGIGEQLSIDLSRFQNISVISYYSTTNFNLSIDDLKELKKITGLDYVLTGSVRYNDETVRLNIQLIQAEDSKIIWAETYIRHMTTINIFDIQQDIIDQVLNALVDDNGIIIKRNKTHAAPFHKTKSEKVQEAINQYYDYVSNFDNKKFHQTVMALEHAHAKEPNNAMVCALLSDLYIHIYMRNIKQDKTILGKAMELARLAENLDEKSQHVQKVLAIGYLLSGEKQSSLEKVDQCINLNPKSSGMIAAMGITLICLGEYTKGFNYLNKSRFLNPVIHPAAKMGFSIYYFHKKDYIESQSWLQKILYMEYPLFDLINLAIQGKTSGTKEKNLPEKYLAMKDHIQEIATRFIFDSDLIKEILHGISLLGLPVK